MSTIRRWLDWQIQKVLPDPGQSFQRIELDQVLFNEIQWRSDEWVLDVGCYRGHYASVLARRVAAVVGLDVAPGPLAEIQHPSVHPLCGDGHAIPIASGSFDSILCHLTANLFSAPGLVAAELVRCCKPGGRIILTVCNLQVPYQRMNRALERWWPECPWATLRNSQNQWTAGDWRSAFQECGAELSATYSCNLCWPLVPRLRGRWIIPNRVMHSWNRAVRQVSRLPFQTTEPLFAAHDFVLVLKKRNSAGAAA